MAGFNPQQTLALYVHWPFCKAKCPYCDFNSHVSQQVDHAQWCKALLSELDHAAHETAGRQLTSIFFGGGTPSLMEPDTVAALIDRAKLHYSTEQHLEVTLEANPTSVEAGKLREFRAVGVNRVSLGVQSLDDRALKFLGREHSALEALAAVETAAAIFPRWSFDLIYARPDQSLGAWQQELEEALCYASGHMSLYELTIEPATRFHAMVRAGAFRPLDEDLQADLFEFTQERMTEAGMPAYEISNHARQGEECRHNLTYWTYQDYAGIGPGAHGRLRLDGQCVATQTEHVPARWLQLVDEKGTGERDREIISPQDQVSELLLNGLRLVEGIAWNEIDEIADDDRFKWINRSGLKRCISAGLVEDDDDHLKVSPIGRLRLDAIIRQLLY